MGGARPERYRGTAVQWVSGPGLCTSDLVLPRAQPATCGIDPQRDDGSVLGVFVGAWWLGEVLHWQDWTTVCLMVVAIASVLWPSKKT